MNSVELVTHHNEEGEKLAAALAKHNIRCSVVALGSDTPDAVIKNNSDLLIMDMTEPKGLDHLLRSLKQEKGVLILAIAPVELVMSLDSYIDDFVTSTCDVQEIIVRVKRLLGKKKKLMTPAPITAGGLVIDPEKYEVYLDGQLLNLTFKEYELLRFLAANPNRVFTRDTLLNRVWGEDYLGGDRTVDVHIRRLREKIENPTTTYIDTVRNIGYRFKKSQTR